MKPVNLAERRRAFGNFLVLFIATMALILAAVFFSVEVPFKQNEKLQAQVTTIESEKLLAERFANKLNETLGYFETVNKPSMQSELLNEKITQNLTSMSTMVSVDSTMFRGMYQNIISSLLDYQGAKKALRGASSQDATLTELQNKISQCMSDNASLRINNTLLMQQVQQLQQR